MIRKKIVKNSFFLLMLFFIVLLMCNCNNNNIQKTNVEKAEDALNSAYNNYFVADYDQSMEDVDSSLAYSTTEDALLFKAQLQDIMDEKTAADATLDTFNAAYPTQGTGYLLRAYFLSKDESTDGDKIFDNLKEALDKNYGDIGYETYWDMVEDFEGFAYFRTNFPTLYASLEALKQGNQDTAREGVTKYEKGKIGPAIYIKHADMWMIKSVRDLEALLFSIALPKPYNYLVSQAIQVRTFFINAKDKGRGVKMQWTWAIWVPNLTTLELFWTSSQ